LVTTIIVFFVVAVFSDKLEGEKKREEDELSTIRWEFMTNTNNQPSQPSASFLSFQKVRELLETFVFEKKDASEK
jgi:hypothetical protein